MSDNTLEQSKDIVEDNYASSLSDLKKDIIKDAYDKGLSNLQGKESQEDEQYYPPEIEELIQEYPKYAGRIKGYWKNFDRKDPSHIKFLDNEIFGKVAMIWAEEYTRTALQSFEKYQDKEYAEKLLKKTTENLITKNEISLVLVCFDKYKDKELAEEILKKVMEKDPQQVLKFFDRYKEKPYASNLIRSIPLTELLFLTQSEFLPKHKLFESIKSLFEGLHSIKEVKLSKKTLTLDPSQHLNIYSGLLKTYLANKQDYLNSDSSVNREKVKIQYEENIKNFIEQGEKRSEKTKENINVFIVRATNSTGDDDNDALTYNNEKFKKMYEEKFAGVGRFHDYSSDVNPQSPDFILAAFEKNIESDPEGYYLFHLGAHGEKDGSAILKGGHRTKEHFNRLFNIQAKYPSHIKIDLMSCNSGTKDSNFYDNRVKNLSMDSGKQPSEGGPDGSDANFLKAFEASDRDGNLEADYDGDLVVNFNEALLYRNINYNYSLTPTMFDDGSGGRAIDISMSELEKKDIQAG